jgi:trigger factor
MQITETRSEGLARELSVVVPAADLGTRLDKYLDDLKAKVRINGFRPGKVPVAHLRRLYGKSAMAEIVQEVVSDTVKQAVSERDEKPALQPDIDFEDGAIEKVVAGDADLAFTMKYEVLPKIELGSFDAISIERLVATVPAEDIEGTLKRLAEENVGYAPKDAPAATGDKVKVSFVGRIGGEAFEGGKAEDVELVIGEDRFIAGFEDQLIGVTPGDERLVTVSFPEDYPSSELAGKEATFEVEVIEVSTPEPAVVDDALAERLGLESLAKLREAIEQEMQKELDGASRQAAKRALLDRLDEGYQIELPQKLVDTEFEGIWTELTSEMERSKRSFADENTTEEAAREEYRGIAARRVKLGLLLSEIGEQAKVEVTDEEVKQALYQRVRQFPGQERQVFDLYQKNPRAMLSLRAPIYEGKVIDYLLELVNVVDKPVSKDELIAAVSDADPHDHEHHGHEHHDHEHHDHEHHDHGHHDHDHGHHDHDGGHAHDGDDPNRSPG